MKNHPENFGNLTYTPERGGGHCLMGSLTGAVGVGCKDFEGGERAQVSGGDKGFGC